jgi:hypothetical protein
MKHRWRPSRHCRSRAVQPWTGTRLHSCMLGHPGTHRAIGTQSTAHHAIALVTRPHSQDNGPLHVLPSVCSPCTRGVQAAWPHGPQQRTAGRADVGPTTVHRRGAGSHAANKRFQDGTREPGPHHGSQNCGHGREPAIICCPKKSIAARSLRSHVATILVT